MTPYMFFKKHAGFSYDPNTETEAQGRSRCARSLARAEKEGREVWHLVFFWEDDLDGCIGCDCGSTECKCSTGAPHETLVCSVRQDGSKHTLASLGGICEPSKDYGRVVEAELAMEAIAELQRQGAEVNQ